MCSDVRTHTGTPCSKRTSRNCALCKPESVWKTGWVAHVTADGGWSKDESEIAHVLGLTDQLSLQKSSNMAENITVT